MPGDMHDHPFGKRRNGSNGARPEGMRARPVPMNEVREPFDVVAVQADDELLNALAAGFGAPAGRSGSPGIDGGDQVAAMLAAWKADVDAAPMPQIDLDAAVGAVLEGRRTAQRPSGRLRHLVPLASAAALIVVAITGVSVAAHDSRPGDALFSVSKVLYAEEAASYEALATIDQSRARAKQALAVGDKAAAEAAVAEAEAAAGTVLAEHGQGEVIEQLHRLEVHVDETKPGVPNPYEEQPPPQQAAQSGTTASGSATTTPTTTPPAESTTTPQESGTTSPESDTREPGSSTEKPAPHSQHGSSGSEEPGSSSGDQGPGTQQQQGSEPGTDESGPGAGAGPTSEPGPQSAEEPATTGQPSSAGPTTTSPPGPPGPTSGQTGSEEGIAGMSASATGTATPSGAPTTR